MLLVLWVFGLALRISGYQFQFVLQLAVSNFLALIMSKILYERELTFKFGL